MLKKRNFIRSVLALVLSLSLMVSLLSLSGVAAAQRCGDVDANGDINALDATRVLLFAVGKTAPTDEQAASADVNGDGTANAMDATLILLHAVGKKLIPESSEPSEPEPTPPPEGFGDAYAEALTTLTLKTVYADPEGDALEGEVYFTATAFEARGQYTLYFGDENGRLEGYRPLDSCAVTAQDTDILGFTFDATNVAPVGAVSIIAEDKDGRICAYELLPENKRTAPAEPLYTYATISDVHVFNNEAYNHSIDGLNGEQDFDRALRVIEGTDAEFISLTGDLIYANTQDIAVVEAELETCLQVIRTTELPLYAVRGNHDQRVPEQTWLEMTGHGEHYSFEHNGDVFVYLSLLPMNSTESVLSVSFGEENLQWLSETLTAAAGKRVFMFMHFPFYGEAGLVVGSPYGFSADSVEDDQMLSMIEQHGNVTVFSGHTHYNFETALTLRGMSVTELEGDAAYAVHVPSVAYPRDYVRNTRTDESEGYIVEVYQDHVLLRGIDFTDGRYVPYANYRLDVPAGNE